MTIPPRIAREVKRGIRKPNLKRRASHLAFVRMLPCVGCGAKAPSEAAHVRAGTDGGMGTKPSDRYTVPLCRGCHDTQHAWGESTYWSTKGIDPLNLALRLWTVSGDVEAGERAVFRARQGIELRREEEK